MNTNPNTTSDSSSKSASHNDAPISTINKPQGQDSFVKLAMRNMVKKGSTSLFHFALTVFGVIGALLGLAIIFH
jgi:hypothetical protein